MKNPLETIKNVGMMAGIFLLSNVVTPLYACSLPKIKNLLGLDIDDIRTEHFDAEEDRDINLRVPETLDIKYDMETISINMEELLITSGSKDMSSYMFGFSSCSGDIGLFIFGIPGLILSLPIILLLQAIWLGIYKLTDMDKDYYLFYRRIKNNLSLDMRVTLKRALINSSRRNRESHE